MIFICLEDLTYNYSWHGYTFELSLSSYELHLLVNF